MEAKIAEVIINSIPAIKVAGHPFLVAFIGSIPAIGGMWLVQRSNKQMWRNEIFVKKMQEELVKFYDMLSNNIKEEYDSVNLSKLLNNEFDYESVTFNTFFENKLKYSKELEDQFVFIQPILKKCLKYKEEDLVNLFQLIGTSSFIYGYIWNLIETTNQDSGPSKMDFFDIDINECVCGLVLQERQELRARFKIFCSGLNLILPHDFQKIYDNTNNDIYIYRGYLYQIREELNSLKKSISDYMWKEL